ncbi:MAG: ChaN family lipoprotein [Desulfatiglandales bacterium]
MMLLERLSLSVLIASALFILQGCAAMKRTPPPIVTIHDVSGRFWIGQIVDLRVGKAVTFDELIEHISSVELIFLGEVHDNPEHHLVQVQVLQALAACCAPVDLAMEAFQKSMQDSIDGYLQGEMSEAEFLDIIDWKTSWGYDYHLYRPLLLWAKENASRILAVNAPIAVVRKVARKGLEGLEPAERRTIAAEIDLDQSAHREYLRRAYDKHRHNELDSFDHFYEAQCVWEETMAENISNYLEDGENKLVVIAGNGHLVNKYGIPDRTRKRLQRSMITILPYPIHGQEIIERGVADYIWLTPESPRRFSFFHGMKRPNND